MCFGRQSEDAAAESSVTNVAFTSVSSQVYRHHAPHATPVRHHTTMNAQPVLLQPLPSTEFIVSSSCNSSCIQHCLLSLVLAFSALTLLVGWQEGHPARKKYGDGGGGQWLVRMGCGLWWSKEACIRWGAHLHISAT